VDGEKSSTINHWGLVEGVGEGYVTIYRDEWAPGLWAGVRDMFFNINRDNTNFIYIYGVDLENRRIYYSSNTGRKLNLGDALYPVSNDDIYTLGL
jgi:hypothetical protein